MVQQAQPLVASVDALAIIRALQAQQETLRAGLKAVADAVKEGSEPSVAYNKGTGPLTVALDLRAGKGRIQLEVWVRSSGDASFLVEGSRNGTDFRLLDTLSIVGAGEQHQGYMNAYPVIRVTTTATGDNEIEIVAAR